MMKYTNEQIDITKKILKHITIDYPIPYELLEYILGIIEYLQNQNEERFNQLLNMDKLLVKSQEDNYRRPLTDDEMQEIIYSDCVHLNGIVDLDLFARAIEKAHGIE